MNMLSGRSSNFLGPISTLLNNWLLQKKEDAFLAADEALKAHKLTLFERATGIALEIGAAIGTNRKYVSHVKKYIALEPERAFCDRLKTIADGVLCARVESIPLPAESVDTVFCSMTLCSVCDIRKALEEIRRVLRPGGRFLALEHVGAEKGTFLHYCQRVCRPACEWLECGCHPDRNTMEAIRSCGLLVDDYMEFQLMLKTPLVRDWIATNLIKQTSISSAT